MPVTRLVVDGFSKTFQIMVGIDKSYNIFIKKIIKFEFLVFPENTRKNYMFF